MAEEAKEETAPTEDAAAEKEGEEEPEFEFKNYSMGIDLGTTYSCVGIWKDNEVHIIANDQGNRTTPSYVAFNENDRLVGDGAKNQVANNPTNTIFDAKRLIGRKFKDPVAQADIKLWPFKVLSDGTSEDKPMIQVMFKGEVKNFHPEEISSMVLTKMKQTAESYVGQRIKDTVITVPAYFNDSQRQATKDAGEIAGLNVLRIVNEPTAAAIAYGLDKQEAPKEKKAEDEQAEDKHILVFDMGGGTFDVSILTIQDTVFEVRATSGDPHLGGEDFDNRILSHCITEFKRKHKSDMTKNQRALRRLRTQCERAKRNLSSQTAVSIEVDALHDGLDFSIRLSRAKFEELNMDYFKASMEPVSQCLADANMTKTMISEVVMVGGSTRIPKVQQMIQAFFDGKTLCKDINPDEAVAYGAAVQAAIVGGKGSDQVQAMLLLDVAPLSLGIEMSGGAMQILIERNSTIPTTKSQDFTTAEDYQDHVDIKVYEGERAMVKDNNYLGNFKLTDIPKTLRGVAKIKVTFKIDTNGILEVTAEDMRSHNKADIHITNEKGRLTQGQIDDMLAEAEKNMEFDDLAKEEMIAQEALRNYMAKTKKSLGEVEEKKITRRDKERLEKKLSEVDEWLEAHASRAGKQEFDSKQKEVATAWNIIMTRMNKTQADFWEEEVVLPPDAKTIEKGGFIVQHCGLDLRDLIADPE